VAATKCRNKKKEMTSVLISESSIVEELNSRLKNEVERLTQEKESLEKSLSDIKHRSSCKHKREKKLSKIVGTSAKAASSSDSHHEQRCSPSSEINASFHDPQLTSALSLCDAEGYFAETNQTACSEPKIIPNLSITNAVCKVEDGHSDFNSLIIDVPQPAQGAKHSYGSCRYQPYMTSPHTTRKKDSNNSGAHINGALSDFEKNLSLIEKINPFTYPSEPLANTVFEGISDDIKDTSNVNCNAVSPISQSNLFLTSNLVKNETNEPKCEQVQQDSNKVNAECPLSYTNL